jgi:Ca2+ transporting ATPase
LAAGAALIIGIV